jgi:hypothetical protein
MPQTISSSSTALSSPPHDPHGHLLLGHARELQHDTLHFYLRLARKYGDVVRIRLLSQPDEIRQMLLKSHGNYDRQAFIYKPLRPFLALQRPDHNEPLDIYAEMMRATLCIIGTTALTSFM